MRNTIWMCGLVGVAVTAEIASAQSSSPASITASARFAMLAPARGEVRCETCAMIDHVTNGMIHMFDVSGGNQQLVSRGAPPNATSPHVWLASAPQRARVTGEGGRSCGGTSECHEDWRVGDCHVACSGGNQELLADRVERAARSLDWVALSTELMQGEGKLRLNVARSAIQVIGCNDTVAFHIPISKTVVAQVNAWLETATRAE
jgi:hypothetical protein